MGFWPPSNFLTFEAEAAGKSLLYGEFGLGRVIAGLGGLCLALVAV